MRGVCFLSLVVSSVFAMNQNKIVHLSSADRYQQQVEISQHFLTHSETVVGRKVSELFDKFSQEYADKKRSTLSISNLSSRARIYLFQKIIEHKLLKKNNAEYWETNSDTRKPNIKKWDKYPTEFVVSGVKYGVKSAYDENQPGTIFISFQENARSWSKVYGDLIRTQQQLAEKPITVVGLFLEEKKSGLSSILLIRRLIIEANLLLDFEVARRLVDGDRYFGLPIVTYLPYLIKNLEICSDFIEGKKSSIGAEIKAILFNLYLLG